MKDKALLTVKEFCSYLGGLVRQRHVSCWLKMLMYSRFASETDCMLTRASWMNGF